MSNSGINESRIIESSSEMRAGVFFDGTSEPAEPTPITDDFNPVAVSESTALSQIGWYDPLCMHRITQLIECLQQCLSCFSDPSFSADDAKQSLTPTPGQ